MSVYINDIPNIKNNKETIIIDTNYIVEETLFIIKKEENTRSLNNIKLLLKSYSKTVCTQFRIDYKTYGKVINLSSNNPLPDITDYLAEIIINHKNNSIFKLSQLNYNVYGDFELYVDCDGKIYTRFIINLNNSEYILVSVYINVNNNKDFRILVNNSPFLNNNEPIKVKDENWQYIETPFLNNEQNKFDNIPQKLDEEKTYYFFDNRLKKNYSERIIEFDNFSINGNKIQLKDSNNNILNIELYKNKCEISRVVDTKINNEFEIELYKNEYNNPYIRWEKDNYIIQDIFGANSLKISTHDDNIENAFIFMYDLSEIEYNEDLFYNEVFLHKFRI